MKSVPRAPREWAGAPPILAAPSDDELMRRIQGDDREAFGRLYDRHCKRAHRVARSVCSDAGRAEDAVQEGFLSIWRSRGSYRPGGGSFGSWAMTVVRNRALDSVRREGALRRPELVELSQRDASSNGASPHDAVVGRGDDDAVLRAVRRLPDAQAEVITLAFFGELTHTEIAELLALPEGTVKGRMRLGLEKLRAKLEDDGDTALRLLSDQ